MNVSTEDINASISPLGAELRDFVSLPTGEVESLQYVQQERKPDFLTSPQLFVVPSPHPSATKAPQPEEEDRNKINNLDDDVNNHVKTSPFATTTMMRSLSSFSGTAVGVDSLLPEELPEFFFPDGGAVHTPQSGLDSSLTSAIEAQFHQAFSGGNDALGNPKTPSTTSRRSGLAPLFSTMETQIHQVTMEPDAVIAVGGGFPSYTHLVVSPGPSRRSSLAPLLSEIWQPELAGGAECRLSLAPMLQEVEAELRSETSESSSLPVAENPTTVTTEGGQAGRKRKLDEHCHQHTQVVPLQPIKASTEMQITPFLNNVTRRRSSMSLKASILRRMSSAGCASAGGATRAAAGGASDGTLDPLDWLDSDDFFGGGSCADGLPHPDFSINTFRRPSMALQMLRRLSSTGTLNASGAVVPTSNAPGAGDAAGGGVPQSSLSQEGGSLQNYGSHLEIQKSELLWSHHQTGAAPDLAQEISKSVGAAAATGTPDFLSLEQAMGHSRKLGRTILSDLSLCGQQPPTLQQHVHGPHSMMPQHPSATAPVSSPQMPPVGDNTAGRPRCASTVMSSSSHCRSSTDSMPSAAAAAAAPAASVTKKPCRDEPEFSQEADPARAASKLVVAMERSKKSQAMLHDWDRKQMGLKRGHSKTMRMSRTSRERLLEEVGLQLLVAGGGFAGRLPIAMLPMPSRARRERHE